MSNDNGGAAFPAVGNDLPGYFDHHGMSTRAYFAAQALPALIGVCKSDGFQPGKFPEWVSEKAVSMADALIAELNKGTDT